MIWIAAGLTAETMVFTIAGFAWFFFRGYSFAEACAAGIVSMFMFFSTIHQISFLCGLPWLGSALEILSLLTLFYLGRHRLPQVMAIFFSVKTFFRKEPISGAIFFAALAILSVSVVNGWLFLPPPLPLLSSSEGLPEWQTGSLFGLAENGPLFPLNVLGLFNHTARFGLSSSSCGFGPLAVMAVVFSTYALARRYAWPPLALTVSLLVLSMPRLVLLGSAPTGELIHTSTVCFAMVLIYRLVERHQGLDLIFFILCICFSITARMSSIALAPVLMLLMVVVMVRRHGWLIVRDFVPGSAPGALVILLPALVLAQVPAFTLNWMNGEALFGFSVISQNEGIFGALSNVFRYFFSSVDPTEPLQRVAHGLAGMDLNQMMMKGYFLVTSTIPGHAAQDSKFKLVFSGSNGAGFGPFVLLLLVPSMVHSLVRGTRRLKATVVAWAGYLYIISLVAAWHWTSIEALTPFFAANSFILAFSLPPWRLRRRGLMILQFNMTILLLWSLWCFS